MKYVLMFLPIILISSCSSVKSNNGQREKAKYEVVAIPYVVENDTTFVNELRFQRIKSAKDAMKLMYENFGRWNKRTNGRYQDNIDQLIWENITIDDDKRRLLVIADGTETNKAFFASILVFDDQLRDCLHESHPSRPTVLKYFTNKMDSLTSDSSSYKLFR